MNKIAVIGMDCLFPGAKSPAEFWEVLRTSQRTHTEATAEQFGADPAAFYDPRREKADTSYALRGGYVDNGGVDDLPAYVRQLDPMYRWSVRVARGALADAGYLNDSAARMRCGVLLGNLSFPTRHSNRLFSGVYDAVLGRALGAVLGADDLHLPAINGGTPPPQDAYSPGYPAAVVAGSLGLGGPVFALDAACASSLYALGLACLYLQAGKADLMLAGAVSAADPLFVNMGFAHLGAYPDAGAESRPLDASSGGLVNGEGAGMFALKRHADAVRDGDRIYALVSGIGLTNDGRGKHILTPNSKGQVLALKRAYDDAGLAPDAVEYVECHASGTPLGDKTELNSMEIFYYGHATPRIGSVKSNVGHLLTAAGMASMMKLILSMTHNEIPATVGVQHPLASQDGAFAAGQIVTESAAWQPAPQSAPQPAPRRAGVNAFGFGGVSAHVILEANEGQQVNPVNATHTPKDNIRMAITGMDAHFGPLDGLDAFARAIYDGETAFIPLPESRWKGLQNQPELLKRFGLADGRAPDGAYIGEFELDFMKYRIPPNPADEPIPQQLLLLKVADNAIRDAGLSEGGNVAVLIALGTELALHQYRGRADLNWQMEAALKDAGINLSPEQTAELQRIAKDSLLSPAQVNHYTSYIGNIAASRISALWDFNGPGFTISAEENSAVKAIEAAELLLASGDVDAVVVGAVDLAGGLESVLLRANNAPLHDGTPAAGFDAQANGWMIGEGAGAIVLQRDGEAEPARVYATIDGFSITQQPVQQGEFPGTPGAATISQAARAALDIARKTPEQIGYVELSGSGIPAETANEIDGLTGVYRAAGAEMTIAAGSVKANIGHTFAASGIAAVIKTALCLSGRFLPAIPNWRGPALPEKWTGAPFWAAVKSRTWFDEVRSAAISGLSADGSAAHLILSAKESARAFDYLRGGTPALLLIAADDAAGLQIRLDSVEARLNAHPLPSLADAMYAIYNPNARYTACLVGRNADEIRKEIGRAREGIAAAINAGGEWTTPAGSYFTAAPVGNQGEVAFVYPGAFNSYPKLGYELFQLFPALYDRLKVIKADVGEAVAERLLYPRSLEKPGPRLTNAMKTALMDDAVAMVESGLSFAVLYTRIMRDAFGVEPGSAFGYSLGEGSMMWGLGVWTAGDEGSAALHASPLFTTRLAGPMDAVREAWGIPADAPADSFWAAYFIAGSAEVVREAVQREDKVYLTHINTPDEVMIAGDPAACERVVNSLDYEHMRAPFSVVIHNEAMLGEYGEFRRLHDLPVNAVTNVTCYSAADYAPVKLERAVLANSISRMACKQIDFPRLIERAYNGDARVFIELGPRSTCARWIDETLGDRPHLAVSIDNIGVDARTSIIRMLARLVSHRVPLKLDALYRPLPEANGRSLVRTVRLGGEDIYASITAAENELRLENPGATAPATASSVTATRADSAANIFAARPASSVGASPAPADSLSALPAGLGDMHTDFLREREQNLREMGRMISELARSAASGVSISAATVPAEAPPAPAAPALRVPPPNPAPPPSKVQGITPMYDFDMVNEFALGRVANCFGENYAIYDNVRAPRIPNSDLLLMTRVIDITGERYQSKPGTAIHSEYDVPEDVWFYRDSPYPTMPYSVYMEIALQPCGFLSAYHGPTLDYPDIDFYFRNLDGQGTLYHDRDMRGRTITNHVTMLTSTTMQGIIIQKFDFRLYDGDLLFYEGDATFGYFTKEALSSQAGLDLGKQVPRWLDTVDLPAGSVRTFQPDTGSGFLKLGAGQLDFTDEIKVVPGGGTYGEGYAYANTIIDPQAWFFFCHFYQDPVMPGSIGLETIMQALQAYAIETGLGADFKQPHFGQLDDGHNIVWRYRGQILSDSEKSHVEANIKRVEKHADRVIIYADASLWRDKLRIYEAKDFAVAIVDGG